MSRLRNGLAVGALALLILPAGAASAKPGKRSLNQTYPVASRLCANVAAGAGPRKLRADKTQVAALCSTLTTSFTTAQTAYFNTVTPIEQQVIALRAHVKQACATRPSTTCKTARQQAKTTLAGLRAQVRTAASTYRTSVRTARQTFWNAIHTLRGGTGITPDTNATAIAPAVTIPTSV
jgi:hypothetical protein